MRARVVASAGLAAVLAIALAGCNFVTPITTLKPYDPSDGVSTTVGDIDVLNVLVLSEDGEGGNLVFTAVNSSGDDVELTVQYESAGEKTELEFDVPARSSSEFGFGDAGQVFLEGMGTKPGGVLPVYFQYGDKQGRELRVPVLDGSLGEYSSLLPETPTPTPTVTETPVPDPSATPAP